MTPDGWARRTGATTAMGLLRIVRRGTRGRRRPVAAKFEVLAEIRGLRGRVPHVTGVLVATVDGLLVAHETRGVEPETLAAMSAAQLGLGRQFARAVSQGEFLENVTRSAGGYLAVFAAGANALLAVVADAELNLGRLNHEARPVAERVGGLLAAAARQHGDRR